MFLVVANVEVQPDKSDIFLGRLATYINILMSNEPNTLYFDVYRKVLDAKEGAEEYAILEGYADEAAYKAHVESPYRLEHLEKIRECLITGSAMEFISKDV